MRRYIVAVALAGLSLGGTSLSVAADKLELITRVSGVVAEVLVKPGQRVKKGAVLLRLDTTVLQARLDEASAEEARARADEADAKRDMERAQELFNRTVSSTTELDAAELRAPVDGVVNALPGGIGTVVTAECQPKTLVILSPGRP